MFEKPHTCCWSALCKQKVLEQMRIGLQDLNFDHSFIRELPGDSEQSNSLRQVGGLSWSGKWWWW
jgi:hypothetical protein